MEIEVEQAGGPPKQMVPIFDTTMAKSGERRFRPFKGDASKTAPIQDANPAVVVSLATENRNGSLTAKASVKERVFDFLSETQAAR